MLRKPPSHETNAPRREVYVDDADEGDDNIPRTASPQKLSTTRKQPQKPRRRPAPTSPKNPFSSHLDSLFPGLAFPPELAQRILTHASHPAAAQGHNGGLSFIGRRTLETYLLLLLSTSPELHPSDDLEVIVARTLNTYLLGEHVGREWGVGSIMRWVPAVPKFGSVEGPSSSLGLWKVQGDTVSAVVGGVFRQFGASTAHRVFHTRLLPHLLIDEQVGLPMRFHGDAKAACNRMGGMQGPLVAGQLNDRVVAEELSGLETTTGRKATKLT
ncbi:ribonuclease-III-like-domain-containing protein [Desarmillaria tabescens]|uniref:Ribonuclease-III-like-domain-containing protein n=1 Tax=Armillaria tabescens TaxID=1929756 RepID=A0AA39TQV3_ARMTA|nr:ribonuclease-III-like-domain-containing protein [Desarmillaria tabescens]KAK0467337.1 ribonuclease-III-like-domain-containing protein [Desarmillaria tabescens]